MTNPKKSTVYGLALAVVAADSLAAVAVAVSQRPPLATGLGIAWGTTIGCGLVAILAGPRALIKLAKTRRAVAKGSFFNRNLGLMVFSRLDWPLFALAASLIGITATSIVWSLQTILFLLCLRWLVYDSKGQKRYQTLSGRSWIWLGLAVIGLVLVVFGRPAQGPASSGWLTAGLGILIALAGITASALSASRFEWGLRLKDRLAAARISGQAELQLIALGTTMAVFAVAAGLLAAAALAGRLPSWTDFWPGLAMGTVLTTGGIMLMTAVWLKARQLEIGGVFYLTPALTVVLLGLVGHLGAIRPGLIFAGGFLILAANLALGRRRKTPG